MSYFLGECMEMDKTEFVEHKLAELQKLLELCTVVDDIDEQFPDDEDVSVQARKAHSKRVVSIHNVFVDILGIYGETVDFELVDLMEQNFEADNGSEEVDRRVEEYFGKLEQQKKHKIKIKRRSLDETS